MDNSGEKEGKELERKLNAQYHNNDGIN